MTMTKTAFVGSLAALLLFTGFVTTVSAQTGSGSAEAMMETTAAMPLASAEAMAKAQVEAEANLDELETPSVRPGNVFYGLKLVWEGVVDLFASGRAKLERNLVRAEERMAEAVAVHARGNAKAAAKAAVRAQAKVEAASADLEERAGELDGETRAELYVRARNAYNMLVILIERVSLDADAEAELSGQVNALNGLNTALDRVRTRVEAGTEDIGASMRMQIEEGAHLRAGARDESLDARDDDDDADGVEDDGAMMEGEAEGSVDADTGAGTGTVDVETGAGVDVGL